MGKLKCVNAFLGGARWQKKAAEKFLHFPTGEQLKIALADEVYFADWQSMPASGLAFSNLDEITAFLYNAGQNWKRRDYVLRTVYERNLVKFLGYSKTAARNEADWIALFLCSTFRLYDLLDIELGSWQLVDDWMPREEAQVRALPRGSVLHMAPGNVPLSIIISILRALITKNSSVVKLSASDPFTAIALLQSFAEIDPQHPVTKSISIAYWPTESLGKTAEAFAKSVDTIVAWGGKDAIAWARTNAGQDTDVVSFGPKRSLAVIGPHDDVAAAAKRVAIDICLYDQRACFSTRHVFVHQGCIQKFRSELVRALDKMDDILPMAHTSLDQRAILTLSCSHAEYLNLLEETSSSDSWSIVAGEAESSLQHPLGRTIFLTEFVDPEEIYPIIDREVQTVSVFPWEYGIVIRDECVRRGAARIVECGMGNIIRVGGTHDGIYPIHRLVRLVANESPSRTRIKGISLLVDQMDFLEHDKFLEIIP